MNPFLMFVIFIAFTFLFGLMSCFILITCVDVMAKSITVVASMLLIIFWYKLMKGPDNAN